MTNDSDLIKQLEKETGRKLERRKFDEIMRYKNIGFSMDAPGNVTGLNLDRIKLEPFPAVLSKFRHLEKLRLVDCGLTDISFLQGLSKSTHLYLGHNQITDISFLQGLSQLTYLNLGYNKITNISPLQGLSQLTKLILWHNKNITEIPEAIIELGLQLDVDSRYTSPGDKKIYLEGNHIEKPPVEIIRKGKEAIRAYFESLKEEKQALKEVKVLLVGDGGAGKTSLVKQLLGKEFDEHESQTHGIDIEPWKIKVNNTEITVRLWDFGGQEIMHATHQFFLSKRSLYILVLDGRKDEKAEYWLKHIQSFGGDSPALVVINKTDENPGFDLNRSFLQDKYKNIKGFYRVSCADKTGIEDFSRVLGEELSKVKMLQTTWARSWFNVKIALEQMKDHFIDYHKYEEMCLKENITETAGRDTLVDFLNDLGVVLHFKEFDLEDTHVLEPEWVTEAVYKIINSGELVECNGVLNIRSLDTILKKKTKKDYVYPKDKYRYIITLMKKFEICYGIDDETVLIPDLLAVQEPTIDFDYPAALKFIIQYEFLPRSVMPRFIVNMHNDIKENFQWRTGVVLEDMDFQSTAVVKADHEAKRIYLYVEGGQKRDYFAVLLATLRRINQSFEKLKTTELVPMPDDPEITANYKQLIRFEEEGIENYLPGESEKKYKVKDLLGTIADRKATEEEILQILGKIKTDQDTMETLLKKANDTVILQPNFMGVGIDVKALIQKLFQKKPR